MILKLLTILVALGVVAGVAADAVAQGQGPKVKYKKETRYDFDDDLVEGELQRPEGEFIDTSGRAKHSSLIAIRENFIPELLKSAENI